MIFANLFASPAFNVVSRNIIAALLYDIGMNHLNRINAPAIEKIFFDSITEGGQNVLSSDKTKRRILENLQKGSLKSDFDNFHRSGRLLEDEYFEQRISLVLSPKNAQKIAPLFLEHFRQRLAADPELARQILVHYLGNLQQGEWGLKGKELQDFHELIEALKREAQAEYEESLFVRNPGSGQMAHLGQYGYVLPVRGLRKIESSLASHTKLCVTGNPGCGKSFLISAYIHTLVFNKSLKKENFYYYRFVPGISDFNQFTQSLITFLQNRGIKKSREEIGQNLPVSLMESKCFFVFDDVHDAADKRILNLLREICRDIDINKELKGKIIIVAREIPEKLTPSTEIHYEYEGLSVAETSALLKDKWDLKMPRMIVRQVSRKLVGNPELVKIFKAWWQCESHTDTELERLVEQMPAPKTAGENSQALSNYICERLYESFERIDSRLNNFMKGVSLFRRPESERFLDEVYNKIGGGDFQAQLENAVEDFNLLEYDDNLDCYKTQDRLRDFYYQKIDNDQIKRMLHKSAASLYLHRFEQTQKFVDAIEGARHFQLAERDEEAVKLLNSIMEVGVTMNLYWHEILHIFKKIDLSLLENPQLKLEGLFHRGELYLQQGLTKAAENDLTACEKLSPPQKFRGEVLYSLAEISRTKGKLDQAVILLQESLEYFKKQQDNKGMAAVHAGLGDIYILQDKHNSAVEMMEKSLALSTKLGAVEDMFHAYNRLGWLYLKKNQLEKAHDYYKRSLALAEKTGDPENIARSLHDIAGIHERRGECEQALRSYLREIQIINKTNDRKSAAKAFEKIGNLFQQKRNWQKAIDNYQEAQKIYEEIEDFHGLASVYYNIGMIYQSRNELELAMGFFQKSQEIYERTGNLDDYGQSFIQMATVYKSMKEWERALDMYDKALDIKEKLGDSQAVAEIYAQIGDLYHERGEREYAREVYQRSIDMREKLGDLSGISRVYFRMAEMDKAEQNWESAIKQYEKSLPLFEADGNTKGMAEIYFALGSVRQGCQEWSRAIDCFEKSLLFYKQIEDSAGMATVYYRIGTVYHDTGKWDSALNMYKKSLPMLETAGDLQTMAQALGNISSIEFEQKNYETGIGRQVEILLFFQENNQSDLVEKVLANLVSCHQELGQDTFQQILNICMDRISGAGVQWGKYEVLSAEKAAALISQIFHN